MIFCNISCLFQIHTTPWMFIIGILRALIVLISSTRIYWQKNSATQYLIDSPCPLPLQFKQINPLFRPFSVEHRGSVDTEQVWAKFEGLFFSECVSWEKDGECGASLSAEAPLLATSGWCSNISILSLHISYFFYHTRLVHVYYQTLLKMQR